MIESAATPNRASRSNYATTTNFRSSQSQNKAFSGKASAAAPQMVKFTMRGRKITVGECKFVFERVWGVTCDHQHKENEEHDHGNVQGIKTKHEVMLTDLFHIINYSGILLNKA